MGGHGGLNILPQKRWNVYNYENREKVRRDEEQAAREEQLKREQTRKRDSEIRLERLRTARGLAPSIPPQPNPSSSDHSEPDPSSSDPGHINLFEGIKIFDPIREPPQKEGSSGKKRKEEGKPKPKPKPAIVVGPEDEKYRLGYGLAGKGVQLPWYVRKKSNDDVDVGNDKDERGEADRRESNGQKKRKTMEELREERLKREKKEKDRERALKREKEPSRRDVYYGSRNRFTR